MTLTEERFTSLDATLDAARRAWADERKALEDKLLASELELKLTKEALDKAIQARSIAERTSAKLVAQFGMVSQVFEDAKELAIEAGFYTKLEDRSGDEHPGVAQAKEAIDEALRNGK